MEWADRYNPADPTGFRSWRLVVNAFLPQNEVKNMVIFAPHGAK